MYDKLVLIQEQFNYSANVQLDMDNSEKLLHYIPNDTSVKLLKDYFVDIVKDSPDSHSHMIYGSYGTGKSHFLTVHAFKQTVCERYCIQDFHRPTQDKGSSSCE